MTEHLSRQERAVTSGERLMSTALRSTQRGAVVREDLPVPFELVDLDRPIPFAITERGS